MPLTRFGVVCLACLFPVACAEKSTPSTPTPTVPALTFTSDTAAPEGQSVGITVASIQSPTPGTLTLAIFGYNLKNDLVIPGAGIGVQTIYGRVKWDGALLELAEGKRHGWSLIRSIQQRDGGERLQPANFYRTLRSLRDDGLIADASRDADADPAERRQYFSLTPLGVKVARAEVARLEALVVDARTRRLLRAR